MREQIKYGLDLRSSESKSAYAKAPADASLFTNEVGEKNEGERMQLTLFLVGLVVDAADPILWIAPIVAACVCKRRWWVVPLAALIWGAVIEFALRPQLMPGYAGEEMGPHLAAALLNGFVVLGIASVIWKLRGPDRYPAARPPSPPPPAPGQNWSE